MSTNARLPRLSKKFFIFGIWLFNFGWQTMFTSEYRWKNWASRSQWQWVPTGTDFIRATIWACWLPVRVFWPRISWKKDSSADLSVKNSTKCTIWQLGFLEPENLITWALALFYLVTMKQSNFGNQFILWDIWHVCFLF